MTDPSVGPSLYSPADSARAPLWHTLLEAFSLVAGVALLIFGATLLGAYFDADRNAAAYSGAPLCQPPSAMLDPSCYGAVDATVTQVERWTAKYGTTYRMALQLPTGSRTVWLASGPAPARYSPVGVKVWRGRVTLISTPNGVIETSDNPLWQAGDALLNALMVLFLAAGLLLIFGWQWRAVPGLGAGGPYSPGALGTVADEDALATALGRLILRPVRASDAPSSNLIQSQWAKVIRIIGTAGVLVVGMLGDPIAKHDRLLWITPTVGALVAVFAIALAWRELYLRRGSLFADAQEFGARNALGMTRRYPRGQLQRIVMRDILSPRAKVVFLSNSGQELLRVSRRWWRRDQLQRLASFLKVEAENL
jgi:hypothetical protein